MSIANKENFARMTDDDVGNEEDTATKRMSLRCNQVEEGAHRVMMEYRSPI